MAGNRNITTWLDEILPSMLTQISTVTGIEEDRVYLSLEDDFPQFPGGEQVVIVEPGPQKPEQRVIDGSGNAAALMNGELIITLWVRLRSDQAGRDARWLTDASLGALRKMRLLMKALQIFDPVNNFGDYLLAEPSRLGDAGYRFKARRPITGWGPIMASLEISYLADVTT